MYLQDQTDQTEAVLDIEQTDQYILYLSEHLRRNAFTYSRSLKTLTEYFQQLVKGNGNIFLIGSGYCSELVEHANVDLLKFANVRVNETRVPTITAYGNDYPASFEYCEYFKHHNISNNTLVVLVSLGEYDYATERIRETVNSSGGKCFLITNNQSQAKKFSSDYIFIDADEQMAGDIVQSFMHYLTLATAQYQGYQSNLDWAFSYLGYAEYLLDTLLQMPFRNDIASIGDSILDKLLSGDKLLVFGNGGSASIASYFVNHLLKIFKDVPAPLLSIINLGQYIHYIQESIKNQSFKNTIFSDLMNQIGVKQDDMIVGISTSGNSDNIMNPFEQLNATKIAVLGFGDGGKLGNSNLADNLIIVPDVHNRRSYAIAEDGQRVIFTCILKYLQQKING
jgi:D-sedoheptulose 7-phosphate isomerase